MSKTTTKKLNLKEKLDEDSLDLSLCNLSKVPVKEINDFSKLVNIRELDLSKNQLQLLPDNFGQLINLKNLDLLGNNLTSLPTSFSELKSLQWLDLKDNPLDPELRKAAGECGDEAQCKKCALNVVKYMKQVAADEERKRQIELKKRKEEQARKDAEEKEKENLLKLQKKQEREQRRLINEQKRKEIFEKQVENKEKSFTEQSEIAKKQQSKSTKRNIK